MSNGVKHPELDFGEDGTPVSRLFGDVYFSRAGGAEESAYTFFEGADVPRQWRGRDVFTIGETGFGTGLNFLVTLAAWKRDAQSCARLEFLSVEGWPLTVTQAIKAHAGFPELADEAAALQAVWPEAMPGLTRLELMDGKVGLTLAMGEAAAMFAQINARVDAWYLDGFAPAKNPEMWRDEVMDQLARLSRPGTTLASFTAAGAVRRALAERGFAVDRRPGFGRKRHAISAIYQGQGADGLMPWQRWPVPRETDGNGRIAVIGGGIAGACMGHALHRAGQDVTVWLAGDAPGDAASGNARGIVMPRMDAADTPINRFYAACMTHARRFYLAFPDIPQDWCGAVEILADDKAIARAEKRIAASIFPADLLGMGDAGQASGLAALKGMPALLHLQAGWLSPQRACAALLAGVAMRANTHIHAIRQTAAGWALLGADGEILDEVAQIVLATGADLPMILQASALPGGWSPPLSLSRGQVTEMPPVDGSEALKSVLIGDGYLLPVDGTGLHVTGASFDPIQPGDDPGPVSDAGHSFNLRQTGAMAGAAFLSVAPAGGRTGRRLATADRLPLCGPVPDESACREHWADAHRARSGETLPDVPPCPGLWVLSGLGARGLTTAPLLAATLAAAITGAPLPLPQVLLDLVDPRRFILRALKRGS